MNTKEIQDTLKTLSDKKYKEFQSALVPSVSKETIIGVRIPKLRELAKRIYKEDNSEFLNDLPHAYYDENLLHALLIMKNRDFDLSVEQIESFLPYIDNWAVCDILSFDCFKKHKKALLSYIRKWVKVKHPYTCRFGIEMLMKYYLDEDFKSYYLKLVYNVHSKDYYVNMMIAWYFATALAKQWEDTIKVIEEDELDKWVHNKTISKAIESYRITDEEKQYLKALRRK